ncbi:MAG TPA: M20/M25/M40 family metallo-hydrolase [Bryobacteraceae bacterium]|nr:M20/M25/M40 family metallo-hydrolase [Bryobacteraceae bacterium]
MKNLVKSLAFFLAAVAAAPQNFSLTPEVYRALAAISGDSLRGNLSFIAGNLLEGRDTPSRGLDIAALYIAAQFRRAGLEPAGNDGYFQTAQMLYVAPAAGGFTLRLESGSRTLTVAAGEAAAVTRRPLDLSGVPIYKIANAAGLQAAAVNRKVVMLAPPREDAGALEKAAAAFQPAAFLEIVRDEGPLVPRLIDPDEEHVVSGGVPRLIVRDPEAVRLLKDAPAGETGITLSVNLPEATAVPVTVRNVAAVLRGSDPALRDQYLLLTAHYDHIGRNSDGVVFPGANDDGSGTVSVIEIARALAAARVHPKRSIVFMLFFGEEEGDLGSRYYISHPLFPLARTVADLNLEQVGRTDSTAGPEISNATLTGFQYSTVTPTLQEAGELTGVKVYETPNGDEFFERSDNETFAERGIPAHTLVVAFDFPDYHAAGDTWQKIDFGNMAKVDRMVALAAIMLADNPAPPHWNRKNPKVTRYLKHSEGGF